MHKKEDLRIVKTKKNLYEALILLMKEKNFEEIKVSDICEKSMINRSTFYDHFEDKYELLDSLIKGLENELTMKLGENDQSNHPKQYFMKMIDLFFAHVRDKLTIYNLILAKNNNGIVMDMVYQACLREVKEYIEKQSNLKQDIPADVIASFYVSGVIHICLEYVRNPNYHSKEEILSYLNILIPDDIC